MAQTNFNIPEGAEVVTKSDTAFVNYTGLYIGGTGNVNVVTAKGDTVLFSALPVGAQINLHIVQVLSTSTTATLIVGFKA